MQELADALPNVTAQWSGSIWWIFFPSHLKQLDFTTQIWPFQVTNFLGFFVPNNLAIGWHNHMGDLLWEMSLKPPCTLQQWTILPSPGWAEEVLMFGPLRWSRSQNSKFSSQSKTVGQMWLWLYLELALSPSEGEIKVQIFVLFAVQQSKWDYFPNLCVANAPPTKYQHFSLFAVFIGRQHYGVVHYWGGISPHQNIIPAHQWLLPPIMKILSPPHWKLCPPPLKSAYYLFYQKGQIIIKNCCNLL